MAMARDVTRVAILLLLLPALAGSPLAAGAPPADDQHVLVVAITEGPDPIPQIIWAAPDGIWPPIAVDPGRADGRPHIAHDGSGPVVVWAYRSGGDHDVALLRWTGAAWAPLEIVAGGPANEIDPRAFVTSSGLIHAVWWVPHPTPVVQYAQGRPGTFGYRQSVAIAARRPSVVQWLGSVLVAFERDAAAGQQIVLATRGGVGGFTQSPLFQVARTEPLDVVLHAEGGVLWMDWKASDTEMAYSIAAGATWSSPVTVPWHDPSWAGTEEVRATIRQIVLVP